MSTERKLLLALPYALLVPVLVVMAQSGLGSWSGRSWRDLLIFMWLGHLLLLGVVVFALSWAFIYRWAETVTTRWFGFLTCIVIFTGLMWVVIPELAE